MPSFVESSAFLSVGGPLVDWIGWHFNFFNGVVSLHPDKQAKLISQIEDLLKHRQCTCKQLEKFTGLALWVTHLFLPFRALLHWLFSDLYSCPATHYSVNSGFWTLIKSCLSDELTFLCTPTGAAIPAGSKLVSVRHTPVQTLQKVESVRLTDRRLWLRIINPKSQQRKLSVHSRRVLKLWLDWLRISPPLRSMRPPLQVSLHASADASAQGDSFQVGGLIESGSTILSFAERWKVLDVKSLDIRVRPDAQRDIPCYETEAQGFLVLLCLAICPTACIPLHFQSLSDNIAADPLNRDADLLSRCDMTTALPAKFDATHRHRMSLQGFFRFHRSVTIYRLASQSIGPLLGHR